MSAREWEPEMRGGTAILPAISGRIEAAPSGGGTPTQGLTHSSDLSREGLGVKPTRIRTRVRCEICGREVFKCKLTSHQKTKPCIAVASGVVPVIARAQEGLSEEQRFWRKVDRSGDCWLWMGSRSTFGHGKFYRSSPPGVKMPAVPAHRYAHELLVGPVPESLVVRHKCDNAPCVNPDHLELGTVADNNHDKKVRGRARNGRESVSHCPQGHAYDDVNTYVDNRGKRYCRTCQNRRRAERRAAKGDSNA